MKIVVLDGYTLNPGDNAWDPVAALGELVVHDRTPEREILRRAREAEVLLTNKTPLLAPTLARLPALRFISVLATGYNVVDTQAARARSIPVSNVPEYSTESVTQHVFALLLELCLHVGRHSEAIKAGEWTKSADFSFWRTPLVELAGKTMGIIGFGRIGRRVGEVAHAFGMNVIAHDVNATRPPPFAPFAWKGMREVFAESDVVTLHCPLTADNLGLVNSETLGLMKRDAYLINAARGGLVVDRDLADALNRGVIAGAALDVVAEEPLPAASPLLRAKNLVMTPHVAWATLAARRRLMLKTAENIAAFLAGKPTNVVN